MKKTLLLLGMLLLSSLCLAQVSKQKAIEIVMDSVVGSDSTNVNVYMEPMIGHEENTKRLLETLPMSNTPKTIVEGDRPTVANLSAEIMENDEVLLTWDYPEGDYTEMTLSWSNMEMEDCFGFQAGQCATDQTQLFDTLDLRNLDGWKIKDVTVILSPYDSVLISPYDTTYPSLGNYYIRIWKGSGEDLGLEYEEMIESPVFGRRPNTVALTSDIYINKNSELRLGYYLDQYTYGTWAYDNQLSANNGKSALIQVYNNYAGCNPNYWYSASQYNLCISSTLSNPNGQGVAEGLTGYRVYRNGDLIATIPFAFQSYYTDTEFTKGIDVEYCVTAVYDDEESEPVCATVTITGVAEEQENDGLTLSPNPTSGLVRIEGATAAEVRVYNALGQLVKTARNTNEINLRGLPQGMYLLRITDEDGATATRKIVMK